MPYNPRDPKVADAKKLAEKYSCEQVIIIMFDRKSGRTHGASYGKTKALCAEAGKLLNTIFNGLGLN